MLCSVRTCFSQTTAQRGGGGGGGGGAGVAGEERRPGSVAEDGLEAGWVEAEAGSELRRDIPSLICRRYSGVIINSSNLTDWHKLFKSFSESISRYSNATIFIHSLAVLILHLKR